MRQVARVTVFLILGTLSLAKTTQPASMDSYEDQEVNMSCSHTDIATNEYVFWYRQAPHQGPHFIIQGYKTNVANEVASLFIPVDRKSSTLSLRRVALSDAAVYYCIVVTHGVSRGEEVEQRLSTLSVQEGDSSVINCTYSDSGSVYFPWYKQEAGKGPQLITYIHSNMDRNQNQRYTVLLDKKAKHFSLHISATQPGDTAIYFCAASAQCSPDTCSLSSNLPVGLDHAPFLCCRLSSAAFAILLVCKWQLAHRH